MENIELNEEVEKFDMLIDEISEGIRNLKSSSSKRLLNMLFKQLKESSSSDKHPHITYATLLFRQYANIANDIKESKAQKSTEKQLSLFNAFDNTNNNEYVELELVGWSAMNNKLFWYRTATGMLVFISFVLMSTVPNIRLTYLRAWEIFSPDCPYAANNLGVHITGHFDFRAYQIVLSMAVIVYLHTLFFLFYYLLPTDENNHKFIPGLNLLLDACLSIPVRSNLNSFTRRCLDYCATCSRFLEMLSDIVITTAAMTATILASVVLERGVRFDFRDGNVTYYTLETFSTTFQQTYPVCVDEDPTPKIRASLAMLYLAIFIMIYTTQITIRKFRAQWNSRLNTSGVKSFRLSTCSDDHDHDSVHGLAELGHSNLAPWQILGASDGLRDDEDDDYEIDIELTRNDNITSNKEEDEFDEETI